LNSTVTAIKVVFTLNIFGDLSEMLKERAIFVYFLGKGQSLQKLAFFSRFVYMLSTRLFERFLLILEEIQAS
jgi:hypothetical protein